MWWRSNYVVFQDNYVPALSVSMYENVQSSDLDNGLKLQILRVYRDTSDLIDVAKTITAGKVMHRDFFDENQAWLGKQSRLLHFELGRIRSTLRTEPLYKSIMLKTVLVDISKVLDDIGWSVRMSKARPRYVK